MTTITFLGGDETGNVAFCEWGRFRFDIRVPVECDDVHIIAKARNNRFFAVDGDAAPGSEVTPETPAVKLDPLAKARAAKAAKRAASHEVAGTAYDSGASGYELQGRKGTPE